MRVKERGTIKHFVLILLRKSFVPGGKKTLLFEAIQTVNRPFFKLWRIYSNAYIRGLA